MTGGGLNHQTMFMGGYLYVKLKDKYLCLAKSRTKMPLKDVRHTDLIRLATLMVGWLVVLRLNVPVNNFSVISGRSHRFLGN